MKDDQSKSLSPYENTFHPMRLFEDFFRGFSSPLSTLPAVDVEEKENEFLITVDVPGLGSDDVKLEVTDDRLTIEAERQSQETTKSGSEKMYSSFRKTFILPTGTDADAISADVEKGVLTIRVPRTKASKARRIEIGKKVEAAKH